MGKQEWKPGNMLYPLPAVMVSCADKAGNSNILTVAWAGTVCSNPPMVSISVRPERYSYAMLQETGEFVINLTTQKLAFATDLCGASYKGKPGESGMQGQAGYGSGKPYHVCGGGGIRQRG